MSVPCGGQCLARAETSHLTSTRPESIPHLCTGGKEATPASPPSICRRYLPKCQLARPSGGNKPATTTSSLPRSGQRAGARLPPQRTKISLAKTSLTMFRIRIEWLANRRASSGQFWPVMWQVLPKNWQHKCVVSARLHGRTRRIRRQRGNHRQPREGQTKICLLELCGASR